jgi:hypothetical protein
MKGIILAGGLAPDHPLTLAAAYAQNDKLMIYYPSHLLSAGIRSADITTPHDQGE